MPAELFGDRAAQASQYVDILARRGIDWGLIGPREGPRLWERHVLNSIAVAELIPGGAEVIDLGSGAGLPGIPLALLRPDLRVTLLESLLRRTNFLDLAVAELSLTGQVRVVRARAEEHVGKYDTVTSRAVAPLPKLTTWSLPLLKRHGKVLALKGSSAAAELAQARTELSRLGVAGQVIELPVPGTNETTWAIELRWR